MKKYKNHCHYPMNIGDSHPPWTTFPDLARTPRRCPLGEVASDRFRNELMMQPPQKKEMPNIEILLKSWYHVINWWVVYLPL